MYSKPARRPIPPYPVELDLPHWSVDRDSDLRDEHRQKLATALAVYQTA